MAAIWWRELRAYFQSPFGYISMGLFLVLFGITATFSILFPRSPLFGGVLAQMRFMLIFVVPVLTMRLFTEERRLRTDQLLLTVPLQLTDIVLGKFGAAMTVLVTMLLITVTYPVALSFFGDLPAGETVTAYVGFLLLASAFVAVGCFISSTTESLVVASIVTFVALFLMWVMPGLQRLIPADQSAGIIFTAALGAGVAGLTFLATRNIIVTAGAALVAAAAVVVIVLVDITFYDTFINRFLVWFSPVDRYDTFARGLLNLSPIVYYLTFSAFFLLLTVRMIDKRRWA